MSVYSPDIQARIDRLREALIPHANQGLPVEPAMQWLIKTMQEQESKESLKALAEIAAQIEEMER